ncbi:DeoR/GlpR family DNA-binding transcription regulator [Alicyclobacillus sp.]|uniref:DeoR/GlpR family DNA-binding transcription regulator n=1 Tax=Alicyclobacillus sp. TaxID=61169 RepID=UPI0025BAFBDA|nr:DeoR/GlpR family DNA-binding transcription regulator [Alicyclobacillus sp.]MCL6517906.1 DeoR/GlpR family DNA-binding transcription regulator [Alicyclobacillus sp.]
MLGEIRQQEIVRLLTERGSVRIRDLTEQFGVSEETVRRDLKRLEAEGVLRRTHGGAILTEPVHRVPPPQVRAHQNLDAKRRIAQRAVELVPDRATVMLDNGSTTLEIARRLAERPVTVITNDLAIAAELSGAWQVQLIVLGGTQQKGTLTLVGPECEESIRRYHVDVVFLGAGGISARQGLTTASSAEGPVKRAMMASGSRVYCVADRSKLGRAALVSYARLDEVDAILTDGPGPDRMAARAADAEDARGPDGSADELERLARHGARWIFA